MSITKTVVASFGLQGNNTEKYVLYNSSQLPTIAASLAVKFADNIIGSSFQATEAIMYLFEITTCAIVVIYVMLIIQKCWCKFRAHNTYIQDCAEEEMGYGQPSEMVLGNNMPNLEHGNHSFMQVPVEEMNAGSTAELAL